MLVPVFFTGYRKVLVIDLSAWYSSFNMKNTFMIPLVFLINLVVWVCVLSVFSVLGSYIYLNSLIDGNIPLFLIAVCYRSLFLLPLCIMIAFIFVFFYTMRHKTVLFISIPLIVALAGATVLFAMPLSYSLLGKLENRFSDAVFGNTTISGKMFDSGYIRGDSWSTKVSWIDISKEDIQKRSIILIDAGKTTNALLFYSNSMYIRASRTMEFNSTEIIGQAGGEDPLFTRYTRLPAFLGPIVSDVVTVLNAFRSAFESGAYGYFWLAGSFFIAIGVLWIFCFSTGWRMLNALLVLSFFRMLFYCYQFTVSGPVYESIKRFLPSIVPDSSVPSLVYLAFSGLCFLAGIGIFMKRKITHSGPEAFHD